MAEVERFVAEGTDVGPSLNRHCDVCEFRDACKSEAEKKDDLTLLRGLSNTEAQKLNAKGILTVTQLSYTFHAQRTRTSAKSPKRKRQFALQALAIREKKAFILDSPDLPNAPVHIYLDFEGDQAGKRPYLAGAIVASQTERKCLSLWSDGDTTWQDALNRLLGEIRSIQDFVVFHYGSYEHACLMASRNAENACDIDRVVTHSCNVLSLVYNHVYFPTYSNGLKEVGSFLGCSWPPPITSGNQTLYWRHRWEVTHDDIYRVLWWPITSRIAWRWNV